MTIWWAVIATSVGSYLLKFAGLAAPRRVLDHPKVQRFAELAPVALLSALVAVQMFASGQHLHLDLARAAGVGAAVLALLLRAPFLVILVVAALVTASMRWLGL